MNFQFCGMIRGMELIKGIGGRLREARIAAGLSQDEVGKRIGLTGVGYGAYERGDTLISVENLVAVSNLFDKPVAYLLGLPSKVIGDLPPSTMEVINALEELDKVGRDYVSDFVEFVRQQRTKRPP
jgi:transcriptional regulator with XRE-family HTH domain